MSDEKQTAGQVLADKIKAGLRADRDEDWTKDGLPALDRVSAIAGAKVSRVQVNDVLPGFTRDQASGENASTDEELIATMIEAAGERPVLLLAALDAMSVGRQFSPPLMHVLNVYRQERDAIHEYGRRIAARRDAEEAARSSAEKGGDRPLSRLRFTH